MSCYYDPALGAKVHKHEVDYLDVCICKCGESVVVRGDTRPNFGFVGKSRPQTHKEAKMFRNMIAKKFWVVRGRSKITNSIYTLSHPIFEKEEADGLAKEIARKIGRRFEITIEERDVEKELAKE